MKLLLLYERDVKTTIQKILDLYNNAGATPGEKEAAANRYRALTGQDPPHQDTLDQQQQDYGEQQQDYGGQQQDYGGQQNEQMAINALINRYLRNMIDMDVVKKIISFAQSNQSYVNPQDAFDKGPDDFNNMVNIASQILDGRRLIAIFSTVDKIDWFINKWIKLKPKLWSASKNLIKIKDNVGDTILALNQNKDVGQFIANNFSVNNITMHVLVGLACGYHPSKVLAWCVSRSVRSPDNRTSAQSPNNRTSPPPFTWVKNTPPFTWVKNTSPNIRVKGPHYRPKMPRTYDRR